MESERSLSVLICPHDTVRNMTAWMDLIAAFGQLVGVDVGFIYAHEFSEFRRRIPDAGLLYASPSDALLAAREFGFVPVAAPDHYDEAVLVTALEREGGLEAFSGEALAAVPGQFPTLLACNLLRQKGLQPGPLQAHETYNDVLDAVRSGKAAYGALYRDFFAHLNELSREGVRVLAESEERRFSHVLMLHPDHAGMREFAWQALQKLGAQPEVSEIMAALGLSGWRPVAEVEYTGELEGC
ncbi:PhnD/SsuA/transferrin family substrate-binding protein [Oceanithermus sp.]